MTTLTLFFRSRRVPMANIIAERLPHRWTALPVLGVGAVLWVLARRIADGDFRSVVLGAAVFAAAVVALSVLKNWRAGIYFFVAWMLFEDLVRKYMGNNMAIYFAKDILLAITYISLWRSGAGRDNSSLRTPFGFALSLFFLLGLAQVFNANSPSIFYGILGLKLYFYYVPLLFVGYALIRTEGDLQRFLVVNMGLAGVIALVGIVQTIVGLDFLNPHSGADIEELGHLVRQTPSGVAVPRPCSVFVSEGRFSSYLLLAFILGLGAAGYLILHTQRGRKLVFPALALVGLAAVMTGSRGAFANSVASFLVLSAGFLWGAPRHRGGSSRPFKAIRQSLVMIALSAGMMIAIFPQQIGARWTFYRETVFPDSPDSEVLHRAWDYPAGNFLFAWSDPNWMIGHGIGTASLGLQYVTRILGAPAPNIGAESGYGVLILEFGILGLVLWLAWTFSLIVAASKLLAKLRGTRTFPVALSISWFVFLLLFPSIWGTIVMYQNFVLNAYLWLLVGILFRLPQLELQKLPENG
jgi:hypothetical protein